MSHCRAVCVSAEPRLHAALVSAAKVMRYIQCCLVMYCRCVCVRVCVCVCPCVCKQNISKSYERISIKFYGDVRRGPGRNSGGCPDSFVDPGFSRILYHQQIGLA